MARRRYPGGVARPDRQVDVTWSGSQSPTLRARDACGVASAVTRAVATGVFLRLRQDLVDQAVLLGLLGGEDFVAVDVLADLLGDRPVWLEIMSSSGVRIRRISRAWISMSEPWP